MIRTAIKFGIFCVVCLAVTVYLAFTIGNIKIGDPLNRDYYVLKADFDDVTGLSANDNVKIAGVVVGKVTAIKVDKGRARITFQVQNSYKVPKDSSATIRWRNLIGQRYVYLDPTGARSAEMLKNGDTVEKTESVIDLGELFNRLGPIIASVDEAKVNDFLDTVTQALSGNEDKVGKAIDDLAVLAKALGQRDQTIGRLVENLNTVAGTVANRDQQIRIMLDNLVLISQTFSENTQTIDTALQEFARFSTSLNAVLSGNRAELDNLINNLDLVLTETVAPKLSTLSSALANLDVAAKSIFESSDLGEWLNQSIFCLSLQPPSPGLGCAGLPYVPGLPLSATSASPTDLAATPAAQPNIGAQAGSQQAGIDALVNILKGVVG